MGGRRDKIRFPSLKVLLALLALKGLLTLKSFAIIRDNTHRNSITAMCIQFLIAINSDDLKHGLDLGLSFMKADPCCITQAGNCGKGFDMSCKLIVGKSIIQKRGVGGGGGGTGEGTWGCGSSNL